MKITTVKSSWLATTDSRLDTSPYVSGAIEIREKLRQLKLRKDRLENLTTGPEGGIFNGPMFSRIYVDSKKYGVPFMGSSAILRSECKNLPLLSKAIAHSSRLSHLEVKPGMTLISCSGTIGKTSYARESMSGAWASQHVMKIVADPCKVSSGYLYAFLSCKFGVPLITASTYGSIIQSIAPHQIAPLEVPRLGEKRETEIHQLVEKSAKLLSQYAAEIQAATEFFFDSVGLKDIPPGEWHDKREQDLGFTVKFPNPYSFRALNFIPRARELWQSLEARKHKELGSICAGGLLTRGSRFKRIASDEEFGSLMIGQKELFTLKPVGQWLARSSLPDDAFAREGTITVAARGTLGDSELYCRSEFVSGPWTKFAFTEDILKVAANPDVMPRGCLYAFFRSETAFHILRSISSGSKLQDNHYYFLPRIPIPTPSRKDMESIDLLVVDAYKKRHEAVALEDRAIALVEAALDSA
ncbi:restriction endonuclease subunit S [Opitutaceae bacterium TAV4]|nr:restriction endonuclease subunit S [Opitutaceae bacterium TAV4]RRK02165.1 restriction endonuclease subunit S [Opitutaceae bacterium TAV3]